MKSLYVKDCVIACIAMTVINYIFLSLLCGIPIEFFIVASVTACSGFMYAFMLVMLREIDATEKEEMIEPEPERRRGL